MEMVLPTRRVAIENLMASIQARESDIDPFKHSWGAEGEAVRMLPKCFSYLQML